MAEGCETPNRRDLTAKPWDAIVIGAGPAGVVSAALLAERGWNVLLLERATWPRHKVCGGCLTAAAVRMLHDAGLLKAIDAAANVDQYSIRTASGAARAVTLSLPGGVAVDRARFDDELVRLAVGRGATFVAGASATLLPADGDSSSRVVRVIAPANDLPSHPRARVVLACDGIGGGSLAGEPWARWHVSPDAWFGVSTTLPAMAVRVDAGHVAMHVDADGYAGLTRQAGGGIHLAAALRPEACRRLGGPGALVDRILCRTGGPRVPNLRNASFHGTGLLTRRRAALGGHRVLAVGDACGYVEPFTGEGVEWAIRCATEVADLLGHGAADWRSDTPERWLHRHAETVGRSHRTCRAVRWALHRPLVARGVVAVASLAPEIVGNWWAGRGDPAPRPTARRRGVMA